MSGNNGSLGGLTVNLNADTAQFSAAMSKAEHEAEQWSKSMVEMAAKAGAALGAAISVAGFVSSIKHAIDAADALSDSAARANVSVEAMGGIQFAIQQAGGSASTATDAIAKLNRTLADAAAGDKKAEQAFEAIGVAVKDAAGQTRAADQVFADVADRFKSYAEGPEKGALAYAIFKKGGEALLPVLNAGGDALRENLDYWKRFSGISTESAEAACKFNDTLDKMKLISDGTAQRLTVALRPAIQAVADEMLRVKESGGAMNAAIGAAKVVIETITVLAATAAYHFEAWQRRIGGVGAGLAALGRLDLKGFTFISDAVKEDNERARVELEKFSKRVLGLSTGEWVSGSDLVTDGAGKRPAPRLDRDERSKRAKDQTAELERQAKLVQEAEEEAARNVTEAWSAVAKQRNKELEEFISAEQLMWKQVFDEIDAQQAREIEDGRKYMDAIAKDGEDAFKRIEDAVRGWGNTFTNTVADAVMGAQLDFSKLADSIVRDLIRIQVQKNITDPLVKEGTSILEGLFKGVFGGGGGLGGGAAGSSWTSGFDLPFGDFAGFATGGSFQVGGSGGTDSQLVAFRASPDETVSITRPGDAAGSVQVNVINNGPPVSAQASAPRMDGGRMVVDLVLNAARTDSNFRAGLMSALSPAR